MYASWSRSAADAIPAAVDRFRAIYPDTAAVLRAARDAGLTVGVLSNIGYDIRPAFEREGVADLVDHALLKPELTPDEVAASVRELAAQRIWSVCVRPSDVALAAETIAAVDGSPTRVCTVIGFPHGTTSTAAKVAEAQQALADGATELDMVLNIGPQHPATHGVLRLRVALDGERIVSADPVVGYMHRGAEKLFEVRDYRQITVLANRHDWLSAFGNELGVVLAVEEMLGMEVRTSKSSSEQVSFAACTDSSGSLLSDAPSLASDSVTDSDSDSDSLVESADVVEDSLVDSEDVVAAEDSEDAATDSSLSLPKAATAAQISTTARTITMISAATRRRL